MKDVRMSHAFDLKSLVATSPYIIRDRGFFLRQSVLASGFRWYARPQGKIIVKLGVPISQEFRR